jgi:hypothetical protein
MHILRFLGAAEATGLSSLVNGFDRKDILGIGTKGQIYRPIVVLCDSDWQAQLSAACRGWYYPFQTLARYCMSFTFDQFLCHRPYLYHLTAAANLESIVRTKTLRCTNTLLGESELTQHAFLRRLNHMSVTTTNGVVVIRDQRPLVNGAIEFEEGWDLARFVKYVNQHVFFWPGTAVGPISPGLNHFERYRAECPAILRLATINVDLNNLKFSRYNSGAPRCSGGRCSPRGSRTYLPANEFIGTASKVVEVVASGEFVLRPKIEMSLDVGLTWKPLQIAV